MFSFIVDQFLININPIAQASTGETNVNLDIFDTMYTLQRLVTASIKKSGQQHRYIKFLVITNYMTSRTTVKITYTLYWCYKSSFFVSPQYYTTISPMAIQQFRTKLISILSVRVCSHVKKNVLYRSILSRKYNTCRELQFHNISVNLIRKLTFFSLVITVSVAWHEHQVVQVIRILSAANYTEPLYVIRNNFWNKEPNIVLPLFLNISLFKDFNMNYIRSEMSEFSEYICI